ncbi:MAG TPA: transcriptional repressor [Acholeplasmataceae bacterium]|jgi:Fur family ferric uptake transcriptional regulator|nr:transcriptional repressor [Acholeplasmataceae bacterium]
MRMTKQRMLILNLLKKSRMPQSAEMILSDLPDHTMNLSTVYRNLDAFFAEGLISKSTMKNTAYYYMADKEHHHYMICIGCQKMYEIDCHLDHIALHVAEEKNFKITHHDMTVYGYCEACQKRLGM